MLPHCVTLLLDRVILLLYYVKNGRAKKSIKNKIQFIFVGILILNNLNRKFKFKNALNLLPIGKCQNSKPKHLFAKNKKKNGSQMEITKKGIYHRMSTTRKILFAEGRRKKWTANIKKI